MSTKEKNNKNETVSRKLMLGEKGVYISEVINYEKGEDYEDAFKRYYPKDKEV